MYRHVSDDDFASLWNSHTVEEISGMLGMKPDSVRHRAMHVRKRGYMLRHKRTPLVETKLLHTVLSWIEKQGVKSRQQREFMRDRLLFVIAWQLSSTVQEVHEITGKNYAACRTLARQYRDMGVPLKEYPRGNAQSPRCTKMSLEEAVAHAKEKVDKSACGREHAQLAEWLQELIERRKADAAKAASALPAKESHRRSVRVIRHGKENKE